MGAPGLQSLAVWCRGLGGHFWVGVDFSVARCKGPFNAQYAMARACLGHSVHDGAELGLGRARGVERGLQHRAGVQVQRAEAHLLLPKLLLQRLALRAAAPPLSPTAQESSQTCSQRIRGACCSSTACAICKIANITNRRWKK